MKAADTGALVYWFDIQPSTVEDWLAWYLRDHMPSRVGTTFTTGRCFEAIDADSSHMVLFETPTPEALLAPDYLRLLGTVSAEDRQRRGWYTNTVRMTARVPNRMGSGVGNVLAVVRFDRLLPDGDERQALTGRDTLETIAEITGVGSIWVARHDPSIRTRMDAVRVTGHADRSPAGSLMIEAARIEDARRALDRLAQHPAWSSAAPLAGCYRLLYAMTG